VAGGRGAHLGRRSRAGRDFGEVADRFARLRSKRSEGNRPPRWKEGADSLGAGHDGTYHPSHARYLHERLAATDVLVGATQRRRFFTRDRHQRRDRPVARACDPTTSRRTVASCYSWRGVHPADCMERYGLQLEPLLEALIARGGFEGVRPDGAFHERPLWRGSLARQRHASRSACLR
jgi:hypothetical protein